MAEGPFGDPLTAPARPGAPARAAGRPPRVRWLPRERLDRRLDQVWLHRLTLVVAPAGSGKTTLLAGWGAAAEATGAAVIWCRAEHPQGQQDAFLRSLQAAAAAALPDVPAAEWHSAGDVGAALAASGAPRSLVVVDDAHLLAGTSAEAVVERLIDELPPTAALVLASRTAPGFDLSRRRVSGEVLELGADDLRFRSWEVEGLFRDFYGEALGADELARLARRTEGWAAGLQLFHLATQGRSPAARRHLLENLTAGSRIMREYLTRNVVDQLPADSRDFLIRTCVLRRLSGPLCDRLLGVAGSERRLEELERGGVFTVALDDGTYRYHEVLRGHLEGVLVQELGEAEARALSRRAGELLEEDGAIAEAIAAYCRASAWEEVARAAGSGVDHLDGRSPFWLDPLPAALVEQDPWLTLSIARALRAQGRWHDALAGFERAEHALGGDAGLAVRNERLALAAFLGPPTAVTPGWPGRLRAALETDPLAVAHSPADTGGASERDRAASERTVAPSERAGYLLTRGLAELLAGHVRHARTVFRALAEDDSASRELAAVAGLAGAVALSLSADTPKLELVDEIELAITEAEAVGLDWIARIGVAFRSLAAELPPQERAAALHVDAQVRGDRWTSVLAAAVEGVSSIDAAPDAAVAALDVATEHAKALGCGTLETWLRVLSARAAVQSGSPDARQSVLEAERLTRDRRVPGARQIALAALERVDPAHAAEHASVRRALGLETGLAWLDAVPVGTSTGGHVAAAPAAASDVVHAPGPKPRVEIRLFGQFGITVDGRKADLRALKPRSRAVLHLLALDAGRPVHREVLQAAFWPEADAETAARNLHVALSALRHELPLDGAGSLLERDGEAYRLAVPGDGWVDLVEFHDDVRQGRRAHAGGRVDEARTLLGRALELATAELLPEDGPAEWLIHRREEVRAGVTEAARLVAEIELPRDPEAAARACLDGLRVDPHADALWRLLIEARERGGDTAAAAAARRAYADTLAALETAEEAPAGGPEREGAGAGAGAAHGGRRRAAASR